ncbi:MAG TPA: transglutaminase [Alphaproteobacteria bacterium]|jgi:transglutaminase-like putative cysteine protease|nr:transglutaminase [Alphaproteobacteria bacterium]HAM48272.1 transglutaminase [Alphaproteobacteria bacterium]HBA43484.1 transglutaminase [Alphaproteobacteria bacterium]HBF99883.1 transglutaminase [Alphaproteobacteria bacterium]HCO90837.1 transglutaminase [Alphaproteobacteria bacterium]
MLLQIEHDTYYRFEAPQRYTIQTLRFTPKNDPVQQIMRWGIRANSNGFMPQFEDSFGNITHTLALDRPHEDVRITVSGEVLTRDTGGVFGFGTEILPIAVYLRETDLTVADPEMIEFAEQLRGGARGAELTEIDLMHRLSDAIADKVAYQIGQTHSETAASEAFAKEQGVCQDHAHIFVACARRLGVPARYVSGYMWHDPHSGDGEAAHAWAEAYIPDLGWVGFDPSNRQCPTEAYVRMAVGLDYRGAAPILGLRHGGGGEEMEVKVRIAQARAVNQS